MWKTFACSPGLMRQPKRLQEMSLAKNNSKHFRLIKNHWDICPDVDMWLKRISKPCLRAWNVIERYLILGWFVLCFFIISVSVFDMFFIFSHWFLRASVFLRSSVGRTLPTPPASKKWKVLFWVNESKATAKHARSDMGKMRRSDPGLAFCRARNLVQQEKVDKKKSRWDFHFVENAGSDLTPV